MRHGSLFSGYEGLGMAVNAVFGSETVWVSDVDPGACKILAHRLPGVPNLGDITTVDWSAVEPVEIMSGGFPCQPVSHAGKRLGDQDERWLWDEFARAIGALRPRYVFLENVRGLLSAGRGRLFGRVLGDLAAERYDARWVCIPASRVGAPHRRARVFVAATDADDRADHGQRPRAQPGSRGALTADAADQRHERAGSARGRRAGSTDGGRPTADTDDQGRQGTEPAGRRDMHARGAHADAASDTGRLGDRNGSAAPDAGSQRHGRGQDARSLGRVDGEDASQPRERERAREVAGDRGGAAAADAAGQRWPGRDESCPHMEHDGSQPAYGHSSWGDYEPAIRRWERTLGRPAPAPTQPGRSGNPQLSPAFVEWLMGLPAGWVTDVPGLTRNQMLKALGNGVVPQQAEAAIRWLLEQEAAA